MRKTLNFKRAASVFVASVFVAATAVSCRPASIIPSESDDSGIPSPGNERTVSIAYLKTLYNGAPVRIVDEISISGAVVSSDYQGNFYKTLVVDDGTGGIEIRIDMEEIFKRFMIHTRVDVRCNGLWLGSYGGTLQLGAAPFGDYQTQFIPETDAVEHLSSDEEFYGEVKARTLTFSELTSRHVSTFVAFEGVRFADEERGMSWADAEKESNGAGESSGAGVGAGVELETGDYLDTDRHIVDATGDTLIVRTSGHARFAGWILPEGVGRIEGVSGYFNGKYQLVVCDAMKFEISDGR